MSNNFQIARWGRGVVQAVAWSPDGRTLAVASSIGISFYDAETFSELRFIEHLVEIECLAFSPAGDKFAIGTNDGQVKLCRTSDGATLQIFDQDLSHDLVTQYPRWVHAQEIIASPISYVTFSDNGALLAGVSKEAVWLWRVADAILMQVFEAEAVTFAPDGTTIALGTFDHEVQLRRISDGTLINTFLGHTHIVRSLDFSPDGKTIASGSADHSARLWMLADGTTLHVFTEHNRETQMSIQAVFSPTGTTLGTVDQAQLRFWSVSDGELLHLITPSSGLAKDATFSPDGLRVALLTYQSVHLYRVSDGKLLHTLEGYTLDTTSIAVSPDGQNVVTADIEGNVHIRCLRDGLSIKTLEPQPSSVWGTVFSPDRKVMVLVSSSAFAPDGTVQVWNTEDWTLKRILANDEMGGGHKVAFASDGTFVAIGHEDGQVRLWRVSDWAVIREFEGFDEIPLVALSSNNLILAHGGSELVKLWSITNGKLLRCFDDFTGMVQDLAFSPDGQYLALGCGLFGGGIQLRHVSTDRVQFKALENVGVKNVIFSRNGQVLACGSEDGRIRLVRVSDGAVLYTLEGHVGWIRSLDFTPDGDLLVSSGTDGTIRLWRIQ